MDRARRWLAFRPVAGTQISIAPNVAEMLRKHVTLQVEGIDRMYLNACVPRLQWERGVVTFFERHLGQPVASSALMAPRTRDFVAAIERFIKARALPVVEFRKGQRQRATSWPSI